MGRERGEGRNVEMGTGTFVFIATMVGKSRVRSPFYGSTYRSVSYGLKSSFLSF